MKKGFTLAELIAVLVVLALIGMIAIPSVTDVIRENKSSLCIIQFNEIIEAGKAWAGSNIENLPVINGKYESVSFSDLEKYGFIEENLKNVVTGDKFEQSYNVRITKFENKFIYSIYNGDNPIDVDNYCK